MGTDKANGLCPTYYMMLVVSVSLLPEWDIL